MADPNLYVRTSDGVNISLGSNLLDAYHTYRISWNNTNFTIEVDNITTTVTKTFALPMLIQISDYNKDATSLSVDWIKSGLHSYPASGTFTSRVFSLGSTPDFATVGWNLNSPGLDLSGNTALFISVRSGNTATPDGSWTEFQEVTQNQLFKPIGSYLQYKAVLISKDMQSLLVFLNISFTCSDLNLQMQELTLQVLNSNQICQPIKPSALNKIVRIHLTIPPSSRIQFPNRFVCC